MSKQIKWIRLPVCIIGLSLLTAPVCGQSMPGSGTFSDWINFSGTKLYSAPVRNARFSRLAASPTPTPSAEVSLIVCLGDSVTHGYPYADDENTYPARLSALLEAEYGPGSFAIDNQGVNGYKAEDVIDDLSGPDALSEDPDYVMLMVGGNDLAGATFWTIVEIIEETTWEMQSCVDLVNAHLNGDGSHPKVIVSAFIPNLLEDDRGTIAIGLYNQSLEENLSGYALWFTDNWDDFYDSGTGEAKISLMYDATHPNIAGYEVMAENWFNALQGLLASPTPSPTPTCGPPVEQPGFLLESGDYNGDGTSDIAVFRQTSGLWAIRGITRIYFGGGIGLPVSGDYDGDGTTDPAIFRSSSGLWAIRGISRIYFGADGDFPVSADYDGNGCADIAIFRDEIGLWAVRGVTRIYFAGTGDMPVPGDYDGNGAADIAVFRPCSGLWAVRGGPRVYFGSDGDWPLPRDYDEDGRWDMAIFRPCSGLWAIREVSRIYYGTCVDYPVIADYDGDGTSNIGIFRQDCGLWSVPGLTRIYFGLEGDIPVTK
ncbi:MAG: SGNH/GDSL hydrolase family protein [Candidatus Euphemobacter frigidus]|nr:SGNH/GDSL hydrolase family protein [Candidatus Euphemobacter frigidus]MDP8275493.1 SGNH/GDSL hydrolase family protein [Candidatus Euphemobacter frigidus]